MIHQKFSSSIFYKYLTEMWSCRLCSWWCCSRAPKKWRTRWQWNSAILTRNTSTPTPELPSCACMFRCYTLRGHGCDYSSDRVMNSLQKKTTTKNCLLSRTGDFFFHWLKSIYLLSNTNRSTYTWDA